MSDEKAMGALTLNALNVITDEELIGEDYFIDPEKVLDRLMDKDSFKQLSDLIKETMIHANIPCDVKKRLKKYESVCEFHKREPEKDEVYLCDEDSPSAFVDALFALLTKQNSECKYGARETKWNKVTVDRWLNPQEEKPSTKIRDAYIKQTYDAIAVCFALGLNYSDTCDFLNKCGQMSLNIRDAEDAVYIYCLVKRRPLSVAMELINRDDFPRVDVNDEEYTEYTTTLPHSGNTTIQLRNKVLDTTAWANDDVFYYDFLCKNRDNFCSFSKNAIFEYRKLLCACYLRALAKAVDAENCNFQYSKRKKQEYICKRSNNSEFQYTVLKDDVEVTSKFVNKLSRYKSDSKLLKEAKAKLVVEVIRLERNGWDEDNFKVNNNTCEVIEFLTKNLHCLLDGTKERSLDEKMKAEKEIKALSVFLCDVIPGSTFIRIIFPTMGNRKKSDGRDISFSDSVLSESVCKSFLQRKFFTDYNKKPGRHKNDISLRKAIILLNYLDYLEDNQKQLENGDNSLFEGFIVNMNSLLERCQLGVLYYANRFDWLILQAVMNYETNEEEDSPASFLESVIDLSFVDKPGE